MLGNGDNIDDEDDEDDAVGGNELIVLNPFVVPCVCTNVRAGLMLGRAESRMEGMTGAGAFVNGAGLLGAEVMKMEVDLIGDRDGADADADNTSDEEFGKRTTDGFINWEMPIENAAPIRNITPSKHWMRLCFHQGGLGSDGGVHSMGVARYTSSSLSSTRVASGT